MSRLVANVSARFTDDFSHNIKRIVLLRYTHTALATARLNGIKAVALPALPTPEILDNS